MKLDFPAEKSIRDRYSVRTYQPSGLPAQIMNQLISYANGLTNPFGVPVTFLPLDIGSVDKPQKFGTYGIIKGAKDYIGAVIPQQPLALEALGYEFEQLILYAASMGIGTCWLGGTFNREVFAQAMSVQKENLFPAISPVGYPAEKKRLTEALLRRGIRADQRKQWNTLFFNSKFSSPLTQADAGVYALPLEMVRLGPSASNKQPWRIVKTGGAYHFYEEKTQGYSNNFSYDIQIIDIGIAACHFQLTALEQGLKGDFQVLPPPAVNPPEHTYYMFSWVCE